MLLSFSFYVAAQCSSQQSKAQYYSEKSNAVKKSCGTQKTAVTKTCTSKSYYTAKTSKSSAAAKWIPFIGPSLQGNLFGSHNPVAFTGGIEKPVTKHLIVGGDIQMWRTNYENWCDGHMIGKYTRVIPSLRLSVDPGKRYKGFFAGVGLGYAIIADRGTQQAFTIDKSTGLKTYEGAPLKGNWDYGTIAPSVNVGAGFKIQQVPVAISYFTYLGDTDDGTPLSIGLNLKVGLAKVKTEKKDCKKKSAYKSKQQCIIIKRNCLGN